MCTPSVDLPVDLIGNFRILMLKLIWADELADLPLLVDLPVAGNFLFLLFKLIVADQLADVPPSNGI